jgi:hypothetical protein
MKFGKGSEAYNGREMVVLAYDKQKFEKDNFVTHYLDVQINADALRPDEDARNLHLETRTQTGKDGVSRISNGAPYAQKQMDAIIQTAGDKHQPIFDKEGNEIGTAYLVKGSIFLSKDKNGVKHAVLNTTKLEPSALEMPENVREAQFNAMAEAKVKAETEVAKEEAPAKGTKSKAKKAEAETAKEADELGL